jgi:DNA-binding NarL/FixJ family response regulator
MPGINMTSRILIIDDHEVVRTGVRTLLAGNPEWDICGEASDGMQALDKVLALAPDVVILDLSMPALNGFEVALAIRKVAPSTKIVFFSMHEAPATARTVGGDAFVAKASAAKDLPLALERVLQSSKSSRA